MSRVHDREGMLIELAMSARAACRGAVCFFRCVPRVPDGFAIFTPGLLDWRASGTDEVDGGGAYCLRWKERSRGVIWMGIVSGPTQRSPTVVY